MSDSNAYAQLAQQHPDLLTVPCPQSDDWHDGWGCPECDGSGHRPKTLEELLAQEVRR